MMVALPALNEEKTVGRVIEGIPRDLPGVSTVEVVVINDGSIDRTAEIAAQAGAHVLHSDRPRGVGAAFHAALAWAMERGVDLLVTIDADGQFDPADIRKLVAPVISGRADFASASRFMDPALTPEMPWIKKWGNRQMSRLVSRLTGQRFYDVSCGMRCYSRKAIFSLNLLGAFSYTQEVFLNLAFKGLRIVEVPIAVSGGREYGESRIASNLGHYAMKTSRIILRAYRDYHPLRFFGGIALILMGGAALLLGFFGVHYLVTGHFSPHKWAGFSGAALAMLSLILLHIGMIGDMLNRHRVYLEELLYHHRARSAGVTKDSPPPRSDVGRLPRRS